jgi:tripartite-type tricarboxylate transporter receptor subunit TctC
MPMRVKRAGRALRRFTLAAMLLVGADIASAQTYPTRPIRIVVPLPPGSNGDLMPRILGQHLATKLGQPVVIENRSGAAQNLGAEYVFRADPDGYTLLATPQGPLVISPSFVPNLAFDPS